VTSPVAAMEAKRTIYQESAHEWRLQPETIQP